MNQIQPNNSKADPFLIESSLPHNFLAEKMILSCLLINSEITEITLQTLPIEAFYFKNHQEIYKAIIEMSQKKTHIDIVTLVNFLQENGSLQKVGGIQILIELISQIPNLIYFEEYIKLVKDKFFRRCLIKLGYEAVNYGYITNLPLEDILIDFETKIFNLTTETKTQKLSSSAELLSEIFGDLKDKFLNQSFVGLKSGFDDLDSILQGFQKSDLIIIAGRPSMGKTALSLNIAINVIKNSKLPILFFSLEMSKEQIMYRILSMETDINQVRLRNGKLNQNDWVKVNRMINILSKLPLFIDDTSDLSVQNIRSKVKTLLFEQTQIGLIIVDYLQLMQNSKLSTENRVQELSQITRSLKIIAREFNIPVIALSQLSRNVENRVEKKPVLSDLRESGSIEQDADLVLMLYRKNYYDEINSSQPNDDNIELIVAKQRNGPTGTVQLKYDKQSNKFLNLETKIETD
uniref:Replicative DNA helicase n=1 Tax=Entomoneis sp. TaxID=186043 RepID=A0A2U9NQI3_9STRA|nr:DNA replication helicase [Entomoneis sp.]AWT39368.1 DNA replication helicase [Entomoneis sp.]